MDIDLHEIIIELIEAAKKSSKNNSEIWADYSLAESYPEGEEAYFKKRAYEIRKNIYDETFIGRKWVEDKCRLDILETDWMGRAMTVFVSNDIMKYYAWKDLRIFIERILQLLVYEDMIMKRESESKHKPDVKKQYPDKYYAWYHKILTALGKVEQFTPGAKPEIIAYGKRKYNTKGTGFYIAYNDFDLTARLTFVNSLSPKDKIAWKRIIIEISNNDSDVVNYLKEFPN